MYSTKKLYMYVCTSAEDVISAMLVDAKITQPTDIATKGRDEFGFIV